MNIEIPLDELFQPCADRMPDVVNRFAADRASLHRRYPTAHSPQRVTALRALFGGWKDALAAVSFDGKSRDDRLDLLLLENLVVRESDRLERDELAWAETLPLIPCAETLIALEESRRDHVDLNAQSAAKVLAEAAKALVGARGKLDARPTVAARAAQEVESLRKSLASWKTFYAGFDPSFDFWCAGPYATLDAELGKHAEYLRHDLAGADNPDAITGDPIGRDGLLSELRAAWIPYTSEELIARAEVEWAWCTEQLKSASRELGFGDDTTAAREYVKGIGPAPGGQPAAVRDLAREAIKYVETHDLLTVPALARDGWRMEMMSTERQKLNPFFLGGEAIIVSYPTAEMDDDAKRMSQRGNNTPFSRATVQHELIPGHYMQSFSQERYRPYRRIFYTPFWTEGWTLHWELFLWDRGFPRTPEERIGMLFWRMHRCARVLFSLRFHLGEMTPAECVELLVNDVGHERANAEAEVRRSFMGGYDALYQAAYLVGGWQVRALHAEARAAGKTDRAFHDAFLKIGSMPIPAVRAYLLGHPLERDSDLLWRF